MSIASPRLGAGAGLLAALAALGGCGSSGHTPPASTHRAAAANGAGATLLAIQRAAYATQASEGLRLSLSSTVQVAGRTITATGSGYVVSASRSGRITISAAGTSVEEIIELPDVYARLPEQLPGGKRWVRLNAGSLISSLGIPSSGASASDPTEQLSLLKAAGSVKALGSQTLRGTPTTRYAATIQLHRLVEVSPPSQRAGAQASAKLLEAITGLSAINMEVWIDQQGRARRLQMTLPICTPSGRLSATSTVEFYDFGPQPPVTPPPAGEVSEAGAALESAAKRALSTLHCGS